MAHYNRNPTGASCKVKDCAKPMRTRGMCQMHYARWWKHGHWSISKNPQNEKDRIARFWGFVDKRGWNECWPWKGQRTSRGWAKYNTTPAYLMMLDVLGLPRPGPGLEPDHSCRNGWCVNPSHIRPATRSQQAFNTKMRTDNTSGFRGVHRRGDRWAWQIRAEGKSYYKGGYGTPEQAHRQRLKIAKRLHGKFLGQQSRTVLR